MVEVDDGVRVRIWSSGVEGGLPPVLLLHGGPGLWDYLEPVAHMLESLTVVHRFDQRGCGGSDPSNLHTMTRYVADIEALRRHWGHESWVVIGHSFGAELALAYAVAHPDRTAALGYVGGVGVGAWREQYRPERRRRMTDEQWARLELLDGRVSRSRAEEVESGCCPGSARGPVATIAAAIPHARFDIVPDAGHQPWRERPEVIADLLWRLLTVSGSAAGPVSAAGSA